MRMPNILQLERQLEKELDEMPAEDLDDDAYDEYDLIVIPDQARARRSRGTASRRSRRRSTSRRSCANDRAQPGHRRPPAGI